MTRHGSTGDPGLPDRPLELWPPVRSPGRERVLGWIALALLLALATGLRLHDLGGKTVWIDEANSVLLAQLPPGEILARLAHDSSPPLYYFALKGWMGLWGDGEIAIRSLSVLGSLGLLGILFLVGWRLFSLEVAVLAGLLLALSPGQVFYSQQARMYSWIALLSLASGFALWRAVEEARLRFALVYAGSVLTALYLHNIAFFLLPGHLLVLLWRGELKRRPRRWLGVALLVSVGYSPWLPTFLAQLGNDAHYAWFQPAWERMGVLGVLGQTLLSFAPTMPNPPFQFVDPAEGNRVAAAVVLGCAAASFLWLRGPGRSARRADFRWLLLTVFAPSVAALLVSLLVRPSYVPGRSDQIVFPGFLLLVALGIATLRPPALRWTLVLALAFSSMHGLVHYYGNDATNCERSLAARIAATAQEGDAVLCTSLSRASVEYYLRVRGKAPVTFFSYPRATAHHLGSQDDRRLLAHPDVLDVEIDSVWAEVGRHFRAGGRAEGQTFVLVVLDEVNRRFHEDLRSGRRSPRVDLTGQLGVWRCSGTGDALGVDVVRVSSGTDIAAYTPDTGP
jgi:hypothetical protein